MGSMGLKMELIANTEVEVLIRIPQSQARTASQQSDPFMLTLVIPVT